MSQRWLLYCPVLISAARANRYTFPVSSRRRCRRLLALQLVVILVVTSVMFVVLFAAMAFRLYQRKRRMQAISNIQEMAF